jgi:hypothetical protein
MSFQIPFSMANYILYLSFVLFRTNTRNFCQEYFILDLLPLIHELKKVVRRSLGPLLENVSNKYHVLPDER